MRNLLKADTQKHINNLKKALRSLKTKISREEQLRNLYLDLMKYALLDLIYVDKSKLYDNPFNVGPPKISSYRLRELGMDPLENPSTSHTMIGMARLDNIQSCIEDILKKKILGDLIETGVWQGGATIFMRSVLKAYGIKNRTVWVADSFEGCPAPDKDKYPQDADDKLYTYPHFVVPVEKVKDNFDRYGLLDSRVKFLKGWFKDTLPDAPIEKLALIRLDGDLYESIMDGLTHLYHKLSIGGYIIIDDYHILSGCKQAVTDFRESQGIDDKLISIDWNAVYWRRSK